MHQAVCLICKEHIHVSLMERQGLNQNCFQAGLSPFKAALLHLLYTRAFAFHFILAEVLGLTSFRKATDPEDTRDSTDTEVII